MKTLIKKFCEDKGRVGVSIICLLMLCIAIGSTIVKDTYALTDTYSLTLVYANGQETISFNPQNGPTYGNWVPFVDACGDAISWKYQGNNITAAMPIANTSHTINTTSVIPSITVTVRYIDSNTKESIGFTTITPTVCDNTYWKDISGPTMNGYTFGGWYHAETLDYGSRANDQIVSRESTVIYAKMDPNDGGSSGTIPTPNTCTVTFDANGGTVSPTSRSTACGGDVTFPTPNRSGYTFNGWSDGYGGLIPAGTHTLAASYTAVASWTKNDTGGTTTESTYKVHYYGNGNTGEKYTADTNCSSSTGTKICGIKRYVSGTSFDSTNNIFKHGKEVKYSDKYDLVQNQFTKKGYDFKGWNTKADGSGTSYSDDKNDLDLSKLANNGIVKLYAQWTEKNYHVYYYGNGYTKENYSTRIDAGGYADGSRFDHDAFKHGKLVNYNDTYDLVENQFERDGYTFVGWSTKADAKVADYEDNKTGLNLTNLVDEKNIVRLYAVWEEKTYTVYYHGNGYTKENYSTRIDAGGYADGSRFDHDTFKHGVNVKYSGTYDLVENQFEKEGYTFVGWNTKDDGSGTNYSDDQTGLKLASFADEKNIVRLYARWSKEPYQVHYYGNGNDGEGYTERLKLEPDKGGYAAGSSFADNVFIHGKQVKTTGTYNLITNKFTKNGYTFVGWNTKADGSGTNYSDDQTGLKLGSLANSKNIVKLYAQWRKDPYQVHYYGNGNDGEGYTERLKLDPSNGGYAAGSSFADNIFIHGKQVKPDAKYDLIKNRFTKEGYVFVGWNTKADGSGINYEDDQTGLKLGSLANSKNIVKLYAQWRKDPYQVHYYGNGNDGEDYTERLKLDPSNGGYAAGSSFADNVFVHGKQVKPDAKYDLIKNRFTKIGHVFAGWNTKADGSGTSYKDDQTGLMLGGLANSKNIVKLYAQWEIINFTIKYDSNGGTGEMKDTLVTYGVTTAIRKNTFVKEGYTFVGWNAWRKSDNKWYWDKIEDNDTRLWATTENRPKDSKKHVYKDGTTVSKLSTVDGDEIIFKAIWVENGKVDTDSESSNNSNNNNSNITENPKTGMLSMYLVFGIMFLSGLGFIGYYYYLSKKNNV